MHAALLLVGNEILAGFVRDSNLAFVGRALAQRGCPVTRVEGVGDDVDEIAAAVRRSFYVHVPVNLLKLLQPGLSWLLLEKLGKLFFESQLVFENQPTEAREELLAELMAQLLVVNQEGLTTILLRGVPAGDPAFAIQ